MSGIECEVSTQIAALYLCFGGVVGGLIAFLAWQFGRGVWDYFQYRREVEAWEAEAEAFERDRRWQESWRMVQEF